MNACTWRLVECRPVDPNPTYTPLPPSVSSTPTRKIINNKIGHGGGPYRAAAALHRLQPRWDGGRGPYCCACWGRRAHDDDGGRRRRGYEWFSFLQLGIRFLFLGCVGGVYVDGWSDLTESYPIYLFIHSARPPWAGRRQLPAAHGPVEGPYV